MRIKFGEYFLVTKKYIHNHTKYLLPGLTTEFRFLQKILIHQNSATEALDEICK